MALEYRTDMDTSTQSHVAAAVAPIAELETQAKPFSISPSRVQAKPFGMAASRSP